MKALTVLFPSVSGLLLRAIGALFILTGVVRPTLRSPALMRTAGDSSNL